VADDGERPVRFVYSADEFSGVFIHAEFVGV
jgi:hypothetical protein